MADDLVKTIQCGRSATGFAEVTSRPSRTFPWTDSVGYGRAVSNALDDLKQYDDGCKKEVIDKINEWMDRVKCVPSKQCKQCKKVEPNMVRPEDVEQEDVVHNQTGHTLKKGTISMKRNYKVRSEAVRCMCRGQVVVGISVTYQPAAKS